MPQDQVQTHEPNLRFDPFTIDHPAFKKATSKELRVKDQDGYLWFVLDNQALLRYDGHYAKLFTDQTYNGLRMTPKGQLWSSTEDALLLYNRKTAQFERYTTPLAKNFSFWGNTEDAEGRMYMLLPATANNTRCPFFMFDPRTKRFKHYQLPRIINGYTGKYEPDATQALLKPLATDAQGRVWGQVNYGSSNQLGYFDPRRHRLVWYPLPKLYSADLKPTRRPNLDLYWIIGDTHDQYFYMGGWYHNGLLRFDSQRLAWKQYYFPKLATNSIFQAQRYAPQKWIIHTDDAPAIFDESTTTLHSYPHIPDNPLTPPSNPNCIFKMGDKEFWMGKWPANGDPTVYSLNTTSSFFRTVPAIMQKPRLRILGKHKQYLFYYYKEENALVLLNYNERTKQATVLLRQPLNGVDEQGFNAMLPDSVNRTLWLVGRTISGCIWQWDERTNRVRSIQAPIENSLLQTQDLDDIWSIAQDANGHVWIPVFRLTKNTPGVALIKYDAVKKKFIKKNIKEVTPLDRPERYRSILADSRGIIWIGTHDDSRIRWYNPKTNQFTYHDVISRSTSFTNQAISKIIEDHARGVVWIAADQLGLWKYHLKTDQWHKDSLDTKGGVVSIQLTQNGTLWLKGINTLIRYNPETQETHYYDEQLGFKAFLQSVLVKGSDDELFFEKYRFFPHEIVHDTIRSKMVFSYVNVFDKPFFTNGNLNLLPKIELHYDQNFFTVGFSMLSYIQREKNQYAYRLVGFNNQWMQVANTPIATFTNVPAGSYTLQIKGINYDGIASEIRSLQIIVKPPYWQTWWFRALGVVLFLFIVYTIYRYRLNQQTLKSRLIAEESLRKQREAEYQQRIAQTEIAALRAQMNPHFIFNCLNSIQYFAANNEADVASDYLTKFSRLIRLVLENSRSEKVTLHNELETLRLYVEMEAMRFGQKLIYAIEIAPHTDTDTIQIPPLLIQPFVENAIWHGLMHKPEGGEVCIKVEESENQTLTIHIIDNGIGRERATAIQSKSATKKKSFGMKVTSERIALINQLYRSQTQVQIIDLKDANHNPLGTHVVVKIPV